MRQCERQDTKKITTQLSSFEGVDLYTHYIDKHTDRHKIT